MPYIGLTVSDQDYIEFMAESLGALIPLMDWFKKIEHDMIHGTGTHKPTGLLTP